MTQYRLIDLENPSSECMWMDADHSDDPEHDRPAAMQIHMEVRIETSREPSDSLLKMLVP